MSKTYSVEIEGITPYLQNQFSDMDSLETTKKKVIKTSVPKAEDKAYKTAAGKYYIPSVQLERCISVAGKSFKGKGRSSLSTVLSAMVTIMPTEIIDFTPQQYVEDKQTGVNPNTKGRVVIVRPRYDNWKAKFQLTVDTDDIPDGIMEDILRHAGNFVGIGDFRPMKNGKFGRYSVTKFQLMK